MFLKLRDNILAAKYYLAAYAVLMALVNITSDLQNILISLPATLASIFLASGLLGTIAFQIRERTSEKPRFFKFTKKYFGSYFIYNFLLGIVPVLLGVLTLALLMAMGFKFDANNEAATVFGMWFVGTIFLITVYIPGLIFYKNVPIFQAFGAGFKLLWRGGIWTLYLWAFVVIKVIIQFTFPEMVLRAILDGIFEAFIFTAVCTLLQSSSE